ncbi:MAG: glycosyltransferase [Flavobacteriales bacterium]
MMKSQRVLFAVLDWGLGHATRTTPLIRAALQSGHEVHVASRGTALCWLQSQWTSEVTFHTKPGRTIQYSERFNFWRIASQMPAFLQSIEEEKRWTEEAFRRFEFTHLFSDNCYGVVLSDVPSILMTHQLHLPVPRPLQGLAREQVRKWCEPFDQIWVPDIPTTPNWTGDLGHPALDSSKTHCVGLLSHLFEVPMATSESDRSERAVPATDRKYRIVGMVSGPEPHRSIMESKLRDWLQTWPGEHVIFSGNPSGTEEQHGHVEICNHADSRTISEAWQQADLLVCRGGYSTVMDLVCMGKPAILIPTPGQAEQKRLSEHLARHSCFRVVLQDNFRAETLPKPGAELNWPLPPSPAEYATAKNRLLNWLQNDR